MEDLAKRNLRFVRRKLNKKIKEFPLLVRYRKSPPP
jgi:hypothetical protein